MPDSPEVMMRRIDGLIATKKYEWARETLEGIRDTIGFTGKVTWRQEEAVTHIIIGRLKHDVRE